MKNEIKLWLDDLRNPYLNTEYKVPTEFLEGNMVWVRSYDELKMWIGLYGLPDSISFDHDLGDTHYTPEKYWDDYDLSKTWQDIQEHTEKTGLDCVKYIINKLLDSEVNVKDFPTMRFHSANPVGNDNMQNLWKNFLKFKDKL